jgi:N-acetylneuraminate synthase/sialic acid synthase
MIWPIGKRAKMFRVNDSDVGGNSDCYVIAEIGHNHQGNLELAKKMIFSAAECGVNAVKLQKRNNLRLFTSDYYSRPYNSENSFGKTYGEHRESLEFGKTEYALLVEYSKSLGIDFFATAFDFDSADFLNELDVPAFKIASGDLTNIPLINYVASFGKPVFVSTGGADITSVDAAVDILKSSESPFCIMQCTAGYPPDWSELNLNVIRTFCERYSGEVIGFSSHDNGIAMAVVAYVLGARVIEKHFTLDRSMKGTDHAFSLEPQGMRKMIRDLKRLQLALGDGVKRQYPSEIEPLIKMSKKCIAAFDLPKGTILEMSMIEFRSPGDGVPPSEVYKLIGKRLTRDIAIENPITPSDVQ